MQFSQLATVKHRVTVGQPLLHIGDNLLRK